MTPAQRRDRNRQEMVTAILDIARQLMREDGVAALSLNKLARRLGIKTPSLYEYFPSKGAIYDALFAQGFLLFEAQVATVVADVPDFWEALETLFYTYLRFARDNPELFELMFQHPVPGFIPSDGSMALSQRIQDRAEEMVVAAMQSGHINADLDYQEVRDLILAMLGGLGMGYLANDREKPFEKGRFSALWRQAAGVFHAAWGAGDSRSRA